MPIPEEIQAVLDEIKGLAENAAADASEAKSLAADAKSIAESAAESASKGGGGSVTSINEKPEEKKYVVPEGEYTHNGKKLKFLKAKFRLAGDPTLHISEEVAATAGKPGSILDKVLDIEGQDIVKVLV